MGGIPLYHIHISHHHLSSTSKPTIVTGASRTVINCASIARSSGRSSGCSSCIVAHLVRSEDLQFVVTQLVAVVAIAASKGVQKWGSVPQCQRRKPATLGLLRCRYVSLLPWASPHRSAPERLDRLNSERTVGVTKATPSQVTCSMAASASGFTCVIGRSEREAPKIIQARLVYCIIPGDLWLSSYSIKSRLVKRPPYNGLF